MENQASVQAQIQELLSLSGDQLIFEYEKTNGNIVLNLITINPRHEQTFLYHSTSGNDKLDCLEKLLTYVKGQEVVERSFTVQWRANDSQELHTSYFQAQNIKEALEKFSFGKDMESFTIFSITLNPIS